MLIAGYVRPEAHVLAFTIDPASRDGYFKLLAKGLAVEPPSVEVQERGRKWYYFCLSRMMIMMMMTMMMPFPFFYGDPPSRTVRHGLSFRSLVALLPGRSPMLARVCQGLADGVTPLLWDEHEEAT